MKYSRTSLKKLSTCHRDIQKVFLVLITRTVVDLSISYGLRTDKEQNKLYQKGRTTPGPIVTNADGYNKKSKHQNLHKKGGEAVDIQIYTDNNRYSKKIRYDQVHLAYIAGLVSSIVEELLAKGEITHRLRWGGNWDSDGIIKFDQKLQDLCHWETCNV